MGSIFKAAKKVAKRISRPISKITKGIAKGIARVGKSVMKGVAKINKKLGPLGMIAMSIAMPYALGGLSNIIGSVGQGMVHGGMNSGLLGSQNLFLRSIGQVGNAIRTGYQATTGAISKTMSTITNSISKGFQNFAGKFKGQNNIFSKISQGAKNLFTDAKAKAVEWRSKLKFDGEENRPGSLCSKQEPHLNLAQDSSGPAHPPEALGGALRESAELRVASLPVSTLTMSVVAGHDCGPFNRLSAPRLFALCFYSTIGRKKSKD